METKLFKYLKQMCMVGFMLILMFRPGQSVLAAQSTPIATNTTVSDYLVDENDVKYYQFMVDKQGYFNIDFKIIGIDQSVGYGWDITLFDSDGNTQIYSAKDIKKNIHFSNF